MRSDLIFGALTHLENRYELCQLASKATRKLHRRDIRLQDTTNDVLTRFHENNPAAEKLQIEQHRGANEQRRAA